MKMVCPECGSEKIVTSIGEIACGKCGLVLDESIVVSG